MNEQKRLVGIGNQASEQHAELGGQRRRIREELDSLKSLIGEE